MCKLIYQVFRNIMIHSKLTIISYSIKYRIGCKDDDNYLVKNYNLKKGHIMKLKELLGIKLAEAKQFEKFAKGEIMDAEQIVNEYVKAIEEIVACCEQRNRY